MQHALPSEEERLWMLWKKMNRCCQGATQVPINPHDQQSRVCLSIFVACGLKFSVDNALPSLGKLVGWDV